MKNFLSNDLLNKINENVSIKYSIVPIFEDDYSVEVLTDEVNDEKKFALEVLIKKDIKLLKTTFDDLNLRRKILYQSKSNFDINDEIEKINILKENKIKVIDDTNDSPIIKILNYILNYSIDNNISDIHMEGYENNLIIRLRKDGTLFKFLKLPKIAQKMLSIRIKVLSNLDYTIKNLPIDGRFTYDYKNKKIDIRIATTPTSFGENLVLRVLNKDNLIYTPQGIGLRDEDLDNINKLISQPNGLILLSGPTGSGKTSTLYTLIKSLQNENVNIITIEDPVEYKIEGINQISINEKIGLTFEKSLQSILRLDPDKIMIGEIRNKLTAQTAIRASIIGRLVLSTIHTNDSPSAIYRLIDMGIENYLISAGLIGIVSQRLVRILCDCKIKTKKFIDIYNKEIEYYEPNKCERCKNGYIGRKAVFEILILNEDLKRAINNGESLLKLREIAIKSGMIPLSIGLKKLLLNGEISLDDVIKNIMTIGGI